MSDESERDREWERYGVVECARPIMEEHFVHFEPIEPIEPIEMREANYNPGKKFGVKLNPVTQLYEHDTPSTQKQDLDDTKPIPQKVELIRPQPLQASQLLQPQPLQSMKPIEPVNDWSIKNKETVTKWQESVELTSFVYNDTLDQYKASIYRISLITLCCSTIVTLIASLAVALGSLNNQWVVLAFNIVTLLLGVVLTISNGLIKINSWDDKVRDYTQYTERLSALWIILKSELDMDDQQRFKASDFIKRMHGQYTNIITQGPYISGSACETATEKYKTKQFDNFIWNNKYNKTSQYADAI